MDGRGRSSDDLRAEVARHSDSDLEHARANAQGVREELGTTLTELAARLDVPTRVRGRSAHLRLTVLTAARARTELVAGTAAVVLFALVARRIRRSSQRTATAP